jgi:hypothetical protein
MIICERISLSSGRWVLRDVPLQSQGHQGVVAIENTDYF